MNFRKAIEYLLSVPKSFYVSWRLTKSIKKAFKLPIIVRYNTILNTLSGTLAVIGIPMHFGIMRIGFGEVGIFDKQCQRSILEITGKMIIKGRVCFGTGSRICVMKNGILEIGNNFRNSAKMTIVCAKNIKIERDVLTSWDTFVMDTDFHPTVNTDTNQLSIVAKNIYIGQNVWMGMRSVILKGSEIPDGCVIGACSLIASKFDTKNCLLAGCPAKIVKNNITINHLANPDKNTDNK